MTLFKRTICFLLISLSFVGCTSYMSKDIFFTVNTANWEYLPYEHKSLYSYKGGVVSILNIDVSSYLIKKDIYAEYNSAGEGKTDIFITYDNLNIKQECTKNDLIIIINDKIYKPIFGFKFSNVKLPLFGCQYKFNFNRNNTNKLQLKFLKLDIPIITLERMDKVRRHGVPLS